VTNPLYQHIGSGDDKCPNPACKRWSWHGLPMNGCPGSHLFDKKEDDDSAE
jgi:hypothetical protein